MTQENKPVLQVKGLFQVGIVVRDLDESIRLYRELLGIGEWADMEIPSEIFTTLTYNGKPVKNACFRTAMADIGTIQIELIQPVEGNLPHSDFLKEHGEGLHHLGHIHVPDIEAAVRDLEALGFPCTFAGSTESTKFAYMDMTQALGVIVELIEVPQAN